jgi:hypothetical protein
VKQRTGRHGFNIRSLHRGDSVAHACPNSFHEDVHSITYSFKRNVHTVQLPLDNVKHILKLQQHFKTLTCLFII